MKTKDMIGKTLHPDRLPAPMVVSLPEDYDLPCYRIIITAEGKSAERSSYYADILVDESMRIRKVERYKDNYMVNSFVSAFPPALEAVFAAAMQKVTG